MSLWQHTSLPLSLRLNPRVALELVTPPLDGMILPGVTRDSVLSLARGHVAKTLPLKGLPEKFIVSERPVTMKEVRAASKNGTLVELFGAGNRPLLFPLTCFIEVFGHRNCSHYLPR